MLESEDSMFEVRSFITHQLAVVEESRFVVRHCCELFSVCKGHRYVKNEAVEIYTYEQMFKEILAVMELMFLSHVGIMRSDSAVQASTLGLGSKPLDRRHHELGMHPNLRLSGRHARHDPFDKFDKAIRTGGENIIRV